MRFLDAARSAPAKYSLIYAGLSATVMAVLLTLIYGWVASLLERHLVEVVEQQLSVLQSDFAQDGRDAVIGLVAQHAKRPGSSSIHIQVQDGQGRVLAGDLPAVAATIGWQDIELPVKPGDSSTTKRIFRGVGAHLDDNTFILVINETADLRQTRRMLIASFAIAFFVTTLLALVGGLAIGNAFLRRVGDINRTAVAIMDGDLSQRIPVAGWHDEFGELSNSLNRMLTRNEELMEDMRHVTSSVAHDLRTPLGRHRQRLETVRMKARSQAEYEAVIDDAVEDIDAILKTFDAILRIAQIEAGTPRERFTQVMLSEVGESVADAFTAVAEDEGKQLIAHIDPEVSVRGDRELLTQMLVNLIENSLRHTRGNIRIVLKIEHDSGGALLSVSDGGPGIPVHERDHVFRRFYRIDASRSTPGNGLGLSFVAAVVKLHAAAIFLEDNLPGLCVRVKFPESVQNGSGLFRESLNEG